MPNTDAQPEIPVTLLSQALLDLRQARGSQRATREAVIRYFKAGIADGYTVGSLMQWLFFWPEKEQSVFSQVGYSAREIEEFMGILKEKHSARELGLREDQMPASKSPEPSAGDATNPAAGSTPQVGGRSGQGR